LHWVLSYLTVQKGSAETLLIKSVSP
jgi:hypothetical protein